MKRAEVCFLDVEDVVFAHSVGIALTPGEPIEVRDAHGLASAVGSVQQGYYSSLAEFAAAYLFQISQSQPFLNGNKRAAVLSAAGFLASNGYPIKLETRKWTKLLDDVASRVVTRQHLTDELVLAIGRDVFVYELDDEDV